MSNKDIKVFENAVTALSYVLLLVFFTYTPLAVELVSENSKVLSLYNATQSSYLSFLINVGLLLLMQLDYVTGKKFVSRWSIIGTLIAVMILAAICGFAFNATEYHKSLIGIFGWAYLGMTLHVAFICYLAYVKFESLSVKVSDLVAQESY